jgi:hypothetical protein
MCCLFLLASETLAAPAVGDGRGAATGLGAVAAAQDAELARLESLMAATTDPAALSDLQRCAVWVKLACRLAVLEAQPAIGMPDSLLAAREDAVGALCTRVAEAARLLPRDFAFTVPSVSGPEVER